MTELCDTIDTLAMVYLDDELAAEERRELELHLHACPGCRDHIAAERKSRVVLRARLAPPATPALLRARINTALAAEDAAATAANRRTLVTRWVLPGASLVAAAAAILVFVGARTNLSTAGGALTHEAMKVQSRSRPLEVQGASTGPWLAAHFEPDVQMPSFDDGGVRLVGARLVQVADREAANIFWEVVAGPTRLELQAFVVKNVRPGELRGTTPIPVNAGQLWVTEIGGNGEHTSVVTYEDPRHNGYVFTSRSFGPQALLDVVVQSDLIRRTGERVR